MKRCISMIFALVLAFSVFPSDVSAATKTVVESRIEEVRKVYPQDSAFDEWVRVTQGWEYGGCLGIVAYATEKVFHNVYFEGSSGYKKIGEVSTSSSAKMKNLFKKAKPGDVIKWSKNGKGAHYAIFLSDKSDGIYIYEANFGGPNQVWYNHFWRWGVMKEWPEGGADKVSVWRSENYDAVNKKKDARKIKVGTVLTVDMVNNIQIKIVDNSIANGSAVLLEEYDNGIPLPQGIGIRNGYISRYYTEADCVTGDANSDEFFRIVTYKDLEPKKVKSVKVANSAKKTLKVSWKKASKATGYEVYRATEKSGTYELVKTLNASKTSFTNKNLQKGKTYYYKIRAYRTIGGEKVYGSFSKVVSKKVKK